MHEQVLSILAIVNPSTKIFDITVNFNFDISTDKENRIFSDFTQFLSVIIELHESHIAIPESKIMMA